MIIINKAIAKKVLDVVDAGLCVGMDDGTGKRAGHMCVEAAVCYALGEEHDDHPSCVDYDLATLKTILNDHGPWTSYKERARHLRRLAIAQLGSKEILRTKKSRKIFRDLFLKAMYENFVLTSSIPDNGDNSNFKYTHISFEEYLEKNKKYSLEYILESDMQYNSDIEPHSKFCEDFVQILVKMKVPGTKFLYLTKNNKKKKNAGKSNTRPAKR